MSRRDYIALAEALKTSDATLATAGAIADVLAAENARFDRERFLTAVGFSPQEEEEPSGESITVTTIYAGAADREQHFAGQSETALTRAYAYADREAESCEQHARENGSDWAVYLLIGDVHYATDHHPYRSSVDV